jgi:uncharacterized membrane protein
MAGSDVVAVFRSLIEWAALGIEVVAVVVIVAGVVKVAIARGTSRYLFHVVQPGESDKYKHQLGKTLLLGLEFLVAADVVRTVALEPTLSNVGILGVLVAIRTFLSWSLAVEIEGRWPWQPQKQLGVQEQSPLSSQGSVPISNV